MILNVTGPQILKVRDLAARFGERFGKSPILEGQEAETAWLSNPGKAMGLFGPPVVEVDQMIDWIADWLERGGALLDKPTHFETRSGEF